MSQTFELSAYTTPAAGAMIMILKAVTAVGIALPPLPEAVTRIIRSATYANAGDPDPNPNPYPLTPTPTLLYYETC